MSLDGADNPTMAPVPMFLLEGGLYTNSFLTVGLSASSGTIHFTIDGSDPTESSPGYTSPLLLTNSTLVKARVYQAGALPGPIGARAYHLAADSLQGFSSNLPLLLLDSFGRPIIANPPPGQPTTLASLLLIDTFRGRATLQGAPQLQSLIQIRDPVTGGSPWPKKDYKFELKDETDASVTAPLLGLPAATEWFLTGPYDDKTLLNAVLALELHERMGHYALRRRLVEVFVHTSVGRLSYPQHYAGVYVLVETIQVATNRLDLTPLTANQNSEPEISGSYIIKKDSDSAGDLNFLTTGGGGFPAQLLKLVYPTPSSATTNQVGWIRSYLNQFEQTLYATNWLTRTGTNHYSAYIEADSFVDYHWLIEFGKEIDGYRLGNYLHKDRAGRLKMEPVWDRELFGIWGRSFGNANYLGGGRVNGWYYAQQNEGMTAAEHIWLRRLINGTPMVGFTNTSGPGGDPDFTQRIADRWGALRTNVLNGPRLLGRIDELAGALNEAAARNFTKYRETVGTYIWPNPNGAIEGWDVDYVHPTNYLGSGTNSIIGQMKQWVRGRFAWIDSQFTPPPTISPAPGQVTNGASLTFFPPVGATLYYTLDGTDPRMPGGAVRPGVASNSGGVTLTIVSNVHLVARARSGNSWYNTWSGPASITLYTALPPLRITEIMYHPAPPPPGNPNDAENFEFIEVKNIGTTPLNLERFRLAGGVQFDFPNILLAPEQRGLIVADVAAFQSRYGSELQVIGQYTGRLDNGGERIALTGPLGEPILDFEYDRDWYPITDGFGFSLVVVDETAPPIAWGSKVQWRPSGLLDGTPGREEGAAPSFPPVVLNEVLNRSAEVPPTATVELHNLAGAAANISGWYLTDDFRVPRKFRIPSNTILGADGYLTFDESVLAVGGDGNIPFLLSSLGGDLHIFATDTGGNLSGYFHSFHYGVARTGVSYGRYLTSTGEEHFVPLTNPTLGSANSDPLVGPVVITEIGYRPPDVFANGAFWDDVEDEFVELRNISGEDIQLKAPASPNAAWRLGQGIDFSFPPNARLSAGAYLLVVNFDPLTDDTRLDMFRAMYGISSRVPVVGPFRGNLDNLNGDLALLMPGATDANGAGPDVIVDRIRYRSQLPWPVPAGGFGHSLQRLTDAAYGDDPINWTDAGPTPGTGYTPGPTPTITVNPVGQTILSSTTALLSGAATGPGPLHYQWTFNDQLIVGATNSVLRLTNVELSQTGEYVLYALNASGSARSVPASLSVLVGVRIVQPPLEQTVREGTNIALTIVAETMAPPIFYQWRLDGLPIPGATSPYLNLTNVQEADDGFYDVLCTDGRGTITSPGARLTVLTSPRLGSPIPPLQIGAAAGESVTLSAVLRGTRPIWVRWRYFGPSPRVLQDRVVTNNLDFYTIASLDASNAGPYAVILSNEVANLAAKAWTNAVVNVLTDTDADRLPDAWEMAFFHSPTGADPDGDDDADGMSNRAEYIAGTDPTDPLSVLRLEPGTLPGSAAVLVSAVSNRTYTVQYTDDLPDGHWKRLADVPARSTNRVERVPDPQWTTNRYYRLTTPRQL